MLSAFSGHKSDLFTSFLFIGIQPIDDILYCKSVNRMVSIYGAQFEHRNIANLCLGNLYKLLPADRFLRIGRSHTIEPAFHHVPE
ncbi:LytTR family transcriptional regulator DNA-binding domain-containing protein [Dyadobacter fanqingshengii]|uniref:LytTR family transcriptional regulator DNA-binding domain-containing protein n=1 Tax=Dyadobacter fanqingshengii TaxID=2906443 RepID=UPI0035B5D949